MCLPNSVLDNLLKEQNLVVSDVYTIQDNWDHVVGKNFPEFFCDVVLVLGAGKSESCL